MNILYFLLSVVEIVVGVLLPAYATLSLITNKRTPTNDENRKWGTYWILYVVIKIVFGWLSFLPNFLSGILLLIRVAILANLIFGRAYGALDVWENILSKKETWAPLIHQLRNIPFIGK